MTVRSKLGEVRRSLLCALYRRTIPLGNIGPVVSFTFDDFPRTAHSTGGSILEEYGARGTYYVTGGLMNVSNELGDLFGEDDLHSLLEKGHELGTQTFHHSSGRAVSLQAFHEDVCKGRETVEKIVGQESGNFAYPYGHATLRTKKTLGPLLASSRSNIRGVNGPEIDLNLLRGNSLYGDIEQSAGDVELLIAENIERKGWLIFYTHDVQPNPSEYGCTAELFRFAVARAVHEGCRILTVQEVLAEVDGNKSRVGSNVLCPLSQ